MTDDRQPPQDLAAEQIVLGAMMLSTRAVADASEIVRDADFYRPAHATIFRAILALDERSEPTDPVAVAAELERTGDLVRLGGPAYLLDCLHAVPVAAGVAFYAERVADKATMRRLVEAGTRVVQLGYHGEDGADPAELVERSRACLDELAAAARRGSAVREIEDLAAAALERYRSPAPPALSTGWPELDSILNGGLRPGTLTVVGARTGVGKSVIGANVATNVARRGAGALIVSLEMPDAELTDRILANVGGVNLTGITAARLSDAEWQRLEWANGRLRGWPLGIVDEPHLGLVGIRSHARDRIRTARGLALLVVDYLQLVAPADPRQTEQEQVSRNSRGLKLLAKELDIPVVALAQINRGPEMRADNRPRLSDLRSSGAIEQDADVVWLLYRDASPDKEHEIEVHVAKNRHGRTGTAHLSWAPHYSRAGAMTHLEAV